MEVSASIRYGVGFSILLVSLGCGDAAIIDKAPTETPQPVDSSVDAMPFASDELIAQLGRLNARVTRRDDGNYVVDVRNNSQFTDAAIDLVLQCPNVIDLTMQHVAITDAGIEMLEPLRLQRLILNGSPITDAAIGTLVELPLHETMISIAFSGIPITDQSVSLLTKLSHLQRLDLSDTSVTNECADSLATMPLFMLNLTGVGMSTNEIEQLRQRMPRTQVRN